jgi:hypothetical protein
MLLQNLTWSEEKELTTLGTSPQWVGGLFFFFFLKSSINPCEYVGNLIQSKNKNKVV